MLAPLARRSSHPFGRKARIRSGGKDSAHPFGLEVLDFPERMRLAQ
jgi:hypothetical protein